MVILVPKLKRMKEKRKGTSCRHTDIQPWSDFGCLLRASEHVDDKD